MAITDVTELAEVPTERRALGAGIAGITAGAVFGLYLQAGGTMPTIASLVGSDSLAAGWAVHLLVSVVFAFGFAAAVTGSRLSAFVGSRGGGVVLGTLYGVLLWVVAGGVALPLWLGAVGASAPAIPNLTMESLAGHALYGLVLGGLYPTITRLLTAGWGAFEQPS
ncbi:hypothetical protein [Haloglomus litoreum]|uniref:hypothetical protein n=1 Tax=Haloglomus litoreum TaxID=3034026 RepID=UPI0023E7D894|nr:hypothetical protein [Haloglomus sp. DT116]